MARIRQRRQYVFILQYCRNYNDDICSSLFLASAHKGLKSAKKKAEKIAGFSHNESFKKGWGGCLSEEGHEEWNNAETDVTFFITKVKLS